MCDCPRIHRLRSNLDAATLWGELDGAGKEVEENLADFSFVALDLSDSLIDSPVQVNAPARGRLADRELPIDEDMDPILHHRPDAHQEHPLSQHLLHKALLLLTDVGGQQQVTP